LYNNSEDVVYLDSLIIADAEYGYRDEDYIHSVHAYMFPGDGDDYPLAPGEMVIVAQDAMNHSANNSVDLSGAEFEYYAYAPK
jgi:FKBP-type peptidyl-prolyl cis-trans isomerase 2